MLNRKAMVCFMMGVMVLTSCKKRSDSAVCDHKLVINSPHTIDFSKNEKKLLCGDDDVQAWNNLPLIQVELTATEFLKNRGYFDLTTSLVKNTIHIDTGKKYLVKVL